MKDYEIRENFHRKVLNRHHKNPKTLVVDELGLMNGFCRADIAVVNGHLCGFEIKSDSDSLNRLKNQVEMYNNVFDYSSIIINEKHFNQIKNYVSDWWGIIICYVGSKGAINFTIEQKPVKNQYASPYSIAQLLWKDEVIEILKGKNFKEKELRHSKYELYDIICSVMTKEELNSIVRYYLKNRTNWRFH